LAEKEGCKIERRRKKVWATQAGSGSATADVDYTSGGGNLSFAAADTSQSFTVTILPDALVEADETFDVQLSNVVGPGALTKAIGVSTILDNDLYQLSISNATAVEGNAIEFPVTITADREIPVVVEYKTTDGTAEDGVDYSGTQTGSLTIPAGPSGQIAYISIATIADVIDEGDESFSLTISSTDPKATISNAAAEGVIQNNDYTITVTQAASWRYRAGG
jgi:hypothetical protein